MFNAQRSICALFLILLMPISLLAANRQTVTFESIDSLPVTADLYKQHPNSAPIVLLFHQARSSRGEFREIAPRFIEAGYNVLAVDLRSGGIANQVENNTWKAAVEEGKGTLYSDAFQDMEAALRYAAENHADGRIAVLGSSYSASLALILAAVYPERVDAVLAFSPGEYFGNGDSSQKIVADYAAQISSPVFITGKKSELDEIRSIYEAIPVRQKELYRPLSEGQHGAKALWPEKSGSESYWLATKDFLNTLDEQVETATSGSITGFASAQNERSAH